MANIWTDWLNETPDILYQAFMPQGKGTPFADYYNSRYARTYNDYSGRLGQQALNGQEPTLTFYDYLKSLDPFGEWKNLTPRARGEQAPYRTFWNT